MKRNSVLTINGRAYDVVTGEKIVSADTSQSGKSVTKRLSRPSSPAKKRRSHVNKQAQLAAEIADEIAELEEDQPPRAKTRRARSAKSKAPTKTVNVQNAPTWLLNFKSGKDPLAIASDRKFINRQSRAELTKWHATTDNQANRHRAQSSTTLSRRFVHAPTAHATAGVMHRHAAPVATSPLVRHFAKAAINNSGANIKPTLTAIHHASKPAPTTRPTFASSSPATRRRDREKPYQAHELEIAANQPLKKVVRHAQKPRFASHATRQPSTNSRTAYGTKFLDDIALEAAKKARQRDSKILKRALIKEQLDSPIAKLSPRERRQAERLQHRIARRENGDEHRHLRVGMLMTLGAAVLFTGSYLSYANMPNISLHVAAVQAGVNVRSPIALNGYSATGQVAYERGQVTVKYRNNGGGDGYTLTQSNTNLNSATVRQSVVPSGGETLSNGVYRYGNTAVWTNDGTMFTLNGNRYITNEQILQIADSVRS